MNDIKRSTQTQHLNWPSLTQLNEVSLSALDQRMSGLASKQSLRPQVSTKEQSEE